MNSKDSEYVVNRDVFVALFAIIATANVKIEQYAGRWVISPDSNPADAAGLVKAIRSLQKELVANLPKPIVK